MKAACAPASSFGGASVRVATGWPTRRKNSSCPDGAHMHSNRDSLSPALVNACGALAGTLMVSPARATSVSPRKVTWTSPSSPVNISSKSWRCGSGWAHGGDRLEEDLAQPDGSAGQGGSVGGHGALLRFLPK